MKSLTLDINIINPSLHEKYFGYPGDFGPGRLNVTIKTFGHIAEWRDYLLSLQIQSTKIPLVHVDAFHAALRVMLLAWVEPTVIKLAELQALRSLEPALTGAYFDAAFARAKEKNQNIKREDFKPGLGSLLAHAAEHDHLDPTLHNSDKKISGNALNVIRNALAHGDLFNMLPWGGLFESVRAVMEHAYRNSSFDTSWYMPTDVSIPPPTFGLL